MSDLLERWRSLEAVELYRVVFETTPSASSAYDASRVLAAALARLTSEPGVVGPPNTYEAVCRLVENDELRGRLSGEAVDAIQALVDARYGAARSDASTDGWKVARAISYLAINAPATSRQIADAGRLVSSSWKAALKLAPDRVVSVIDAFRDASLPWADRIEALRQLDRVADEWMQEPRLAAVGNWVQNAFVIAMVRRAFAWPLVVASFAERDGEVATTVDSPAVGIAVPVVLDVRYAQPDQLRRGDQKVWPPISAVGTSARNAQAWGHAVHRGREAAFWAWRARHGYHGRDARRIKREAKITINLAESDALFAPLLTAGVIQPWQVDEVGESSESRLVEQHDETTVKTPFSSAESYFAVQLFGFHTQRLLGSATAVTGRLGAPVLRLPATQEGEDADVSADGTLRTNTFISDFEVELADRLPEKLAFCHRSELFARVIVRDAPDSSQLTSGISSGFELTRVSTIQQAVRSAYGQRAAPQRYIRLPDESDLWAGAEGVVHTRIIQALSKSETSILRLDERMEDVLAALRIVDGRLRHVDAAEKKVPPRFAWVAAKLSDITIEQSWFLLWDFCDGQFEDLVEFMRSRTRKDRSRRAEALLNRFAGEAAWEGARAPDLLVLELPTTLTATSADSLLDIEEILSAASLTRSTDSRLDPFFGATRVIVLRRPRPEGEATVAPSPTLDEPALQTLYDALRVFRGAIDVHVMSRFLARVGIGEPHERIESLCRTGLIRRSGWDLYLASEMRGCSGHLEPSRVAETHVAAALALVPLLNVTGGLPTDIDRGHSTEALGEACWHIRRAERSLREGAGAAASGIPDAGTKARSSPLRGTIDRAVAWLYGAILPPSWAAVEVLTSHNPDVALRVMDRIVSRSELTTLPLDNLFVSLAAIWKSRRADGVDTEEHQRLAAALIQAAFGRSASEPAEAWVRAGSSALGSFEKEDPGWSELSTLVARGLSELRGRYEAPPFFVNHRWASQWAGDEADDAAAVVRYQLMSWWVRTPVQLRVEMLGALLGSGVSIAGRKQAIAEIIESCGADKEEWFRRIKKRLDSPGRGKRGAGAPSEASIRRGARALKHWQDFRL